MRLIIDESNDKARTTIRRTRRLLNTFGAQIGALRLMARGVSPTLARAVVVEDLDLATPQRMAGTVLSMIPYFAMLAAFVGGMNVAIDTTAGERERGSLEPLLINPAPTRDLIIGKWLTTAVFNVATTVLALFGFRIALARVPLHELDIHVSLEISQILGMTAALVPLALMASALLMAVATFARSFKEAQTYLSMLVFVPMLPSIVLMLNPVNPALWMMLIPTFSQNLIVQEMMRGEAFNPLYVGVSAATSLLVTVGLVAFLSRLFRNERVVFGR